MMVLRGHGPRPTWVVIRSPARHRERRPAPLNGPRRVSYTDLAACNEYDAGFAAAARVRARTTLVCGHDDKMTPPRVASELAAAIADSRIEVIPACGHIMTSERPEATHRALVAALL